VAYQTEVFASSSGIGRGATYSSNRRTVGAEDLWVGADQDNERYFARSQATAAPDLLVFQQPNDRVAIDTWSSRALKHPPYLRSQCRDCLFHERILLCTISNLSDGRMSQLPSTLRRGTYWEDVHPVSSPPFHWYACGTMEDTMMAEKLWDLANLITGFAVAQCLATLFAVVKGDLNRWLTMPKDYLRSGAGMATFTALYCVALWYCGSRGADLDCGHRGIWIMCTAGRMTAVIVFAAILGVVFWGHWQTFRGAARA